MKKIIILFILLASFSFGKVMTANAGGTCNTKVHGGYTNCHAVNVKYNLKKGRIKITGELDRNIFVNIVIRDKDSLLVDKIENLKINHSYTNEAYIQDKVNLADARYLEISPSEKNPDYSFWEEEYRCYNDDNIPWLIFNNSPSANVYYQKEVRCLPKDTTYSKCKITKRIIDGSDYHVNCFTKRKTWKENEQTLTLPVDYTVSGDELIKAKCPDNYEYFEDSEEFACRKISKKQKITKYENDNILNETREVIETNEVTDNDTTETNEYVPEGGWYNKEDCPPSWKKSDGTCKDEWFLG